MQRYDIILRLRGGGNELPKRNITAAEVHVLDRLHREPGMAAILKIRETVADSTRDVNELARLRGIYGEQTIAGVFGSGVDIKLPKQYTPPAVEQVVEVDPWATLDEGQEAA